MTSESNALHLAQSAFEAVCKERDEARDQLKAMREAIKEVFNSFANEPASDSAWLIRRESPWLDDRQTATLAKLQPFLP